MDKLSGLEVFYDGGCPTCTREMQRVRRLDSEGRIAFTDITSPRFEPTDAGLSRRAMLEKIHARLPDGSLIQGVEVFRQIYSILGFERLVRWTRLPGVRGALDAGYRLFARNRTWLVGRCESGVCEVERSGERRV